MTRRFKFSNNLIVFLCACVVLILPAVAFGQITGVTDDQSTPTPGAGHDYLKMVNETVNPANGSVSIRIGVPVPKGRGLTLPFDFAYDSNGVNHVIPAAWSNAGWTSNNGFGFGGWSLTVPMLTWSYLTATQNISDTIYYCDYVTGFVFQDANGGRHSIGLTYYIDTYGQCMYVNNIPGQQYTGGDQFYNAVTTPPTGGSVMVTNQVDGTAYSFNVIPSWGSATASSVEDRNGNNVTLTGPPYYEISVTDTLGRTAVSVSGSAGSTQTVSVSGLANSYVATWEQQYYSMPQPTQQRVYSTGYCNSSPIPSLPNGAQYVITSIALPNGQSYQFTYDSTYGLLTQITYPTGGWVKYTWGVNSLADQIALPDNLNDPASCIWNYDFPAVTERQVSFDGSNVALDQHFSYTTNSGSWYKTTTVTTTDNVAGNSTATYYGYNSATIPGGFYWPLVPVEGQIIYKDGSSNVYRTVNKTWSDPNLMTCESTTEGGITARTDYYPGAGVPLTDKKEWDWGQAPACGSTASGTPRRETQISYQYFNVQVYPSNYWQYGDPVFSQPTSVTTYYNGAKAAQTTFTYDGATIQSSGVSGPGHDNTRYGTSFTARANATTKSEWLNTGGALNWNFTYDDAGQPRSVQDPNANSTSYSYADDDAYLSQITRPTTNGHAHTASFTYNSADGQLATSVDENSQTTSYFYGENGDELDRLTGVNNPDCNICSSTVHSVSTTYSDSAPSPSVTTSTLLQSGQYSTSEAIMDGVGHTVQTQLQTDPGGTDYAATTYDGFGRAWKVTNPYRGTSDSTYGLTTTTYDALGRTIAVAHPDGSTTTTSYSASGNTYCSIVTDPAGKQRTLCSNALGQLVQVTEGGPNYSTGYSYDAFHFWVTQGGQTRTFTYDSLTRLLSAANPESGTTTYTYDGDSNILTRQDARSITTTYTYDALNRVTSKAYTDGTPPATFAYDESTVTLGSWTSPALANPVGRLTHTTTTSGSTLLTATVQDYDPIGRPKDYWQCTPLNCGSSSIWAAAYTYDFAGDVTSWNHPAGFTITQGINGARQINLITSTLADSTHPGNLAQSITYNAAGAVATLQNGCEGPGCTPLVETYHYNKRLQSDMIELGTTGNPAADSCRVYNFYPGANPTSCAAPTSGSTGNNGNVTGYYFVDNVNNSLSHSASYSYDAVNRLVSAAATGNSTYSQTFTYTGDGSTGQFGNLSCAPAGPGCVAFTYSASTNRIAGYTYDAAGDVTNDTTNTYQWDAEAHLTRVINGLGTSISIDTYNALGQRVRDVTTAVTTDEAYGAGGSLLWQYTGNSSTNRSFVPFNGGILAEYWSGGTIFDHPDELGSATTSSDYTGNNLNEKLFYPYGELWTGAAIPNFNMHQTFAQLYDYDPEIDMYNTPNRHYTPSGRWLSPDPGGLNFVHLDDPQTWNMYAYTRNNPTTLTDPSGEGSLDWVQKMYSYFHPNNWGDDNDVYRPPPAQMTPLQFLGQELLGVYDTTAAPIVSTVEHPVQTVENAASNIGETVKDLAKEPKGTLAGAAGGAKDAAVDFGSQVASGNPRAIGQAVAIAATVAYTAENVRVGAYEHGGGGANLKNTPFNGNRLAVDYHPFGKAGTATASTNVLHVDIKIQQLGINVRHWTP